jgi:hypothetical protein
MRAILILSLLILVLSSFNVLAVHDRLPMSSDWNAPLWDSWKEQDLCKCFSGINAILQRRNPKLDAPLVAEACVNFCTHCESIPKDAHKTEPEKCLGSGFLKDAPALINCMGQRAKEFCKNNLEIAYKEPVYAPPTIKWKSSLPPPPKKETPTPKPIMTIDECKRISQNLLYKIGMDEYCKSSFTLPIFINYVKNEFGSLGKSRDDYSQCSESLWNDAYSDARKSCPVEKPKQFIPPKKEELPLMPKEPPKAPFPWLMVLLIISGALIVAGAIGGIIHVHRKHHEIKAMEQSKIEPNPEEIHEVKEAIEEIHEEKPFKKINPLPKQELRQGISIPPIITPPKFPKKPKPIEEFEKPYKNSQTPQRSALNIIEKKSYSKPSIDEVPIPPTYEGKKGRKTRPLPPEDLERFKFEK